MNIKEHLKKSPLLMDGAIGTYYIRKTGKTGVLCEDANLNEPDVIRQIHREYIEAGADAITTNTFSANRIIFGTPSHAADIIRAGWDIANQAISESKRDVAVFASIGPAAVTAEPEMIEQEYIWIADRFLELGARNFIFETMVSPDGLKAAAGHIKDKRPDSFIVASFAIQSGGYTAEGYFAGDLLEMFETDDHIDITGFNCGSSAAHLLDSIVKLKRQGYLKNSAFACMPNAGYPVVLNDRPFYQSDPAFFADTVADIVGQGAAIVGGCCGTTPDHISAVRRALDAPVRKSTTPEHEEHSASVLHVESAFWNRLCRGEKVIAVELDPPEDADLTRFINGVRELKNAGTDIITIADCPIGRARMDSSLLACKVYREEGIEAIPHMTCRDRNINATKALLMGLYAEGLRNVLFVTGDPVPSAQKDEVKAVYQFNSRKLARFADSLNGRLFPEPMHYFGALNINARNFDIQLKMAQEKEEAGIKGFLTQPVLTQEAFDNLKRARNELHGFILGGIIPVVSERNARFMDNEINGINVDHRLFEMYAGKSREEAEDLAVEISSCIAKEIFPHIDGFYLMTPFMRTSLMTRIITFLCTL